MAKARGRITIDEDRCKGCGLCTNVCPIKIIVIDNNRINSKGYHPAAVTEKNKCTGCANCAIMCPDTVIKVERATA